MRAEQEIRVVNRTMAIPTFFHHAPAGACPAASSSDMRRAIDMSWNRIRYFHVGRQHAYALPPRNDNARSPALPNTWRC